MSNSKSSNKVSVPEAKEAMNRFKQEVASELGVPLKEGYNGDLTSRQAGDVYKRQQYIQKPAHIQQIPKNLPLFFVAGADDPVGNNGKSVTQVCQQYKDVGIQDVQIKLYQGDRHEILNETDRDVVYADILTWLNGHCVRG